MKRKYELRKKISQPHDPSIRYIPLTKNQHVVVDTDDYEWLSRWNWCVSGKDGKSYAVRTESIIGGRNKKIYMHRQIMGFPSAEVDHANGDGLNCLRRNLRIATTTQNHANANRHRDNTSGFKGVFRRPSGNWAAAIGVDRKVIHLGTHRSAEDAAKTYDAAALKYFGEFAKTNLMKVNP